MRWRRKRNELDAEIEAHFRMAVAERVMRGEDEAAARRAVEREIGNVALVKDVAREAWGWVWLERLLQDVRYAVRQLRKSPAFAVTVIATLALGIAAPAAMFTVVDRVMLRPLPYRDAGRLVYINDASQRNEHDYRAGAPYLDLEEWRKWSRSFESIGFFVQANGRNFLEGKTVTEGVAFYKVSANLFGVLGTAPALGRDFRNDPDGFAKNADERSVVISDALWRSMFGGEPNVLGQSVKISGEPYVVVGVMPRGFSFPFDPETPEVWSLAQLGDTDNGRTDGTPLYTVLGRLNSGVRAAQGEAELTTLQKQIAVGYVDPEIRQERSGVWIGSYSGSLVEKDTKRALEMLLAASGVLWLIACVNVTNLLLARAMVRQREVAVRGALGAGRWRIMQQFMAEGLLLSGCGALIGIGLALIAVKLFAGGIKHHLPFPVAIAPDWRMIAGLLLLTVVSALVSSIWPAWMAAHAPIEPALKQGGLQAGNARGQHRMRGVLVVVEIALSLTLLVGCGLLLRTIYALRHVPLGFRTDRIIVANLHIPGYKFGGQNMTHSLYLPLLERAKHLPGVQSAGLMTEVPLGGTFNIHLELKMDASQSPNRKSWKVVSLLKAATPDLQQVFGFKMLAGRFFNQQDTPSSQPVFVVNRAFAREYSPDQQDLSKVIGMKLWHITEGKDAEIVGVLDDMRQSAVAEPSTPEIEASISQITPESGVYKTLEGIAMDLAVRTDRDPKVMIPELREVLRQADPALAGSNFTTMNQVVEDSFGSQRLAAHLLEIFGGSALLLCVAGLYGLLAYVVSQRTRELGVRLALGAQRGDLLWLVLRQASVMLVSGVVIGLGLALASGRVVRSYLYGVSARDGWTLGFVALTLMSIGLLAAYLPARRAAMVNPMEALRAE
ncbi:ABC transporter permease [Alloacidobacterium dinghuense]|uniref:ABC transporter permease n=1 Tax=Alloacidobacterium dinghuense TaxID=2763107 RepID=A0A7G8BJ81_9BACT|nr:ABC transporter permease [Alloacidobacterium dinghuense]QNI32601.1 ABC transporter permease [Alloacidobacterium dinghuense]